MFIISILNLGIQLIVGDMIIHSYILEDCFLQDKVGA